MNAIEINALTKFYGKRRGIEDVSLSVAEGDFFGFIGPNGAGKSTTIRTLLGLIAPTGGDGYIFGKDIQKEKTAILRQVGYLPSEAAFYSGMRVGELLRFSAKLQEKDCQKEAKDLCDRLELDITRKIDELSLGNRKKVGIVAAMQHRPRLYIMDEPTSGLDPLMQRAFYDLLRERNQEGATVFLSSHVLSEVQRYCKHAAVIRQGSILVSDSVENLGHTGAKRVTLRGVSRLEGLEHVRDLKREGETLSFLYDGTADALLKTLAALPVEDVTIFEPDLEEIFLHYYEKEAEQ